MALKWFGCNSRPFTSFWLWGSMKVLIYFAPIAAHRSAPGLEPEPHHLLTLKVVYYTLLRGTASSNTEVIQPYMFMINIDSQGEKEELVLRGHRQVDALDWKV